MSKAVVEINWNLSKSKDIIRQDLVVMTRADGETVPTEFITESLPPDQDAFVIRVPEKTEVFVKITTFDGTYFSKPMVNSFYIADLTVPCPVVNNGWRILEIESDTPCY